jgi:saccharopine dehydrogenase (NADP+, L-glutamate forming)
VPSRGVDKASLHCNAVGSYQTMTIEAGGLPLARAHAIRYVSLMKRILVLGAGQSTPYLIHHLLELAGESDWHVTVGDLDEDLARQRVGDHPRGSGVYFDINDETHRSAQIAQADVVINMLAPMFQNLVAWDCVSQGTHMLSVSYRDRSVRDLSPDAERKGVLLLCEMGLDPGIDHMSAMAVIERVRAEGGRITRFCSYGSGVPAPNQEHNPLRYAITWNPRNVVMASEHGAEYMEDGHVKLVPFHHVFYRTWPVDVDGVGRFEAYPNRDSLSYQRSFGLDDAHTVIRGTLRYPGWSETWAQVVRLGLPNEDLRIADIHERSYRDVVEMFLPMTHNRQPVEERVARFLQISPTGVIMQNLAWLGLFSRRKVVCTGNTPAAMLSHLLKERMPLAPGMRDMVIVLHELDVHYPAGTRPAERISSTLVAEGEPHGFTAMAKTVGLPTALATKLLLTGRLALTGSVIPTDRSIYEPILRDLAAAGLKFAEKVTALDEVDA